MQIGSYKLTHRVGAGGMGIVFRAVDSFGKPVALKMIGSQAAIDATVHIGSAIKRASALELRSRMMLVREASLAKSLKHVNIAQVYDYGQHQGLLYIVMEFLEGQPLSSLIPLNPKVSLQARLKVMRQMCEALDYAHQLGVVHRDVKPANCFILKDGTLKVLDFGIAARLREPVPGEPALVGTPFYMAPELFTKSSGYDQKVDLWAAGVTLYQVLTGRLPFFGPSLGQVMDNIVRAPFPPLNEPFPRARELNLILSRALAKNPRERYASAADLAHDLGQLGKPASDGEQPLLAQAAVEPKADQDRLGASPAMELTTITSSAPGPVSKPTIANSAPAGIGEKIEMISGETPWRHGGHALRFAEFNQKAMPFVVLTFLAAGVLAFLKILGGGEIHAGNDLSMAQFYGLVAILLAYIGAYLSPIALAISVILGFLAFWERFTWVHRCRTCNSWMDHRSRFTAFASSEASWRHATSDCLAALEANLWDDAAKLLTMHGEAQPPVFGKRTSYPPVRYHLDLFSCHGCGDELALLTTDFLVGRNWSTNEEYQGAYRRKDGKSRELSPTKGFSGVLKATWRAARLAADPASMIAIGVLLVMATPIVLFYYPQLPIILGLPGYRASITIQSNPPGRTILVDGYKITTPKTFSWAYNSDHRITPDARFHINDEYYQFRGLSPISIGEHVANPMLLAPPANIPIRILADKDRWGRQVNRPLTTIYTVEYADLGKGMPPPGQMTVNDMMARARAIMSGPVASNNAVAAATNSLASQNRLGAQVVPTILIATDPPGLDVMVDGNRVRTPASFHWKLGSYHLLIAFHERQTPSQGNQGAAEYYNYGRWKPGPNGDQMPIQVPGFWNARTLTYTARFSRVDSPGTASQPSIPAGIKK